MRKLKTQTDLVNLAQLSRALSNQKINNKFRYQKIASKAGIARCTTSKIINGKADVTFTTLIKLLHAMDMSITISPKVK